MGMKSDVSAMTPLASIWARYATAVNANDAKQYSSLFTEDAIRMLPGSEWERGREAIQQGEQADYDAGHWSIKPTLVDAIQLNDSWIYGIAKVEAKIIDHADGSRTIKEITAASLLNKQTNDEWLIARHIINVRSTDTTS